MLNSTASIWSVNALADAIGIPAYTVRRALKDAIRRGLTADRRLGGHFRMVHSDDFEAIRTVLRGLGYEVTMPPAAVVDEVSETLRRAGELPPPQSPIEDLRRRVELLEREREGSHAAQ